MTFSKSWGCGLIGLGLLVASGAHADGLYLGGGVGATLADDVSDLAYEEDAITDVSVSNDDIGYRLFVGYQINNYLAVESFWADYGEFGVRASTTITNSRYETRETGEMIAAGGELRVSFPVKQKTDVYGRIGAAMWELDYKLTEKLFTDGIYVSTANSDRTFDDVAITAAIGTRYHYSANGSVYLEYSYLDASDIFDTDQPVQGLFIGLIYTFNFGESENEARQERNLTACDEKYEEQVGGLICD